MNPNYCNSYGLNLSKYCTERSEKGQRRDPKSIIEVLEEQMMYGDPYTRFRSENVPKLDVKDAQRKDMEDMERDSQTEIDLLPLELEEPSEAQLKAAQREKLCEKDDEKFETRRRRETEFEPISEDATIMASSLSKTVEKENEQPAQPKKLRSKKTETDSEDDRKRQMSDLRILNILGEHDKAVKEGRSEGEKKLQPKQKYRKTCIRAAPFIERPPK